MGISAGLTTAWTSGPDLQHLKVILAGQRRVGAFEHAQADPAFVEGRGELGSASSFVAGLKLGFPFGMRTSELLVVDSDKDASFDKKTRV